MISISQFSKEFNFRHDFDVDDIDILKKKYPEVKFLNIPEAWIIQVDNMMQCLKSYNVVCVQQQYGFLSVILKESTPESKQIIQYFENKMYQIDIDLHKDLS